MPADADQRGCGQAPATGGRPGPGGAWVGLACLALVGCQAGGPRLAGPLDVPREGSAALVAHLADQPFVSAEAGYRAVYALVHGEAFAGEFPALAEALRAEGLVAGRWNHAPQQCLDRGTIGYMVCRACGIRSGLNWMLTGLGRYAWRELQYKGIAEGGSEYGLMTGGELVGILLRAEDYLRRTAPREASGVQLGSAPG